MSDPKLLSEQKAFAELLQTPFRMRGCEGTGEKFLSQILDNLKELSQYSRADFENNPSDTFSVLAELWWDLQADSSSLSHAFSVFKRRRRLDVLEDFDPLGLGEVEFQPTEQAAAESPQA